MHPLAEGCPACVSCGKPMVSDRHLKDRGRTLTDAEQIGESPVRMLPKAPQQPE